MFGYYLELVLRSLKRNKVLTALMVLAIALGIGASMTTLTVLHVLSGDPLPGRSSTSYYPQIDPRDRWLCQKQGAARSVGLDRRDESAACPSRRAPGGDDRGPGGGAAAAGK